MGARFQSSGEYRMSYHFLFEMCKQALSRCNFNLKEVNEREGIIRASAGISFKSLGENVIVYVGNDGYVQAYSECKLPGQTEDLGKNKKNITTYFRNLDQLTRYHRDPNRPSFNQSTFHGNRTPSYTDTIKPTVEILNKSIYPDEPETEMIKQEELPIENTHGSGTLRYEADASITASNEIYLSEESISNEHLRFNCMNFIHEKISKDLSNTLGCTFGEPLTYRDRWTVSVDRGDSVTYEISWFRKRIRGSYRLHVEGHNFELHFSAKYVVPRPHIATRRI